MSPTVGLLVTYFPVHLFPVASIEKSVNKPNFLYQHDPKKCLVNVRTPKNITIFLGVILHCNIILHSKDTQRRRRSRIYTTNEPHTILQSVFLSINQSV